MANTKQTKKYLGGWDTSAYDDVSKASRQAYETNWEALKNRFNAIMEESERQQQLAEKEYANTLASQAESNLRTQRVIDQDLTNRGIINSGIRSGLIEDATAQTGANVDRAISELMNTTKASGETKLNALNNLVAGGNELNANQLEDQLGILKAKQAEDMQGQQLAADLANQAAARAASSGGSDEDEEANEELRQMSVWAILNDIDPETGAKRTLTDGQKIFLLANYYDVKDAEQAVKGFNPQINRDDAFGQIQKTTKKLDKLKSRINSLNKDIYAPTASQIPLYRDLNNLTKPIKKVVRDNLVEKLISKSNDESYKELLSYYNMPLEEYYRTVYSKN